MGAAKAAVRRPRPALAREAELIFARRRGGVDPVLERRAMPGLQAKLRVGAVDDPLEREAEAVAARVMRAAPPAAEPCAGGGSCGCSECRQKAARAAAHGGRETDAPPAVEEALRSPGAPLDAATRAFFEPRFGRDFSRVRVHTDERAAASTASVGALAYTVGPEIAFAAGRYAPHADVGRHLLAHELAHVAQQTGQDSLQTAVPGGGGGPAKLRRVHLGPDGRKAFDCPDFADDPKLEACLNDEDRLRPFEEGPTVAKVQNALLNDGEDSSARTAPAACTGAPRAKPSWRSSVNTT